MPSRAIVVPLLHATPAVRTRVAGVGASRLYMQPENGAQVRWAAAAEMEDSTTIIREASIRAGASARKTPGEYVAGREVIITEMSNKAEKQIGFKSLRRGPKRSYKNETTLFHLLEQYSTIALATMAGVSQQHMWRILGGQYELGLVAAQRIARQTGIDLRLIAVAHEIDRVKAGQGGSSSDSGDVGVQSFILDAVKGLIGDLETRNREAR